MENSHEQELQEIDLFHASVAQRLRSLYLSPPPDRLETLAEEGEEEEDTMKRKKPDSDEFLVTIAFLRKLMDVLLGCEEEFRALLVSRGSKPPPPPVERLVSELLERWVKSLDICNAVTESLDTLRFSHRHAEIAVAALVAPAPLLGGEAQLVRARNALSKLLPTLSPEDRPAAPADRAWSFGRSSRGPTSATGSAVGIRVPLRSLSLKLSRAWSAAKQLHAMASGLTPPRGGGDGGSAAALSLAVYAMSSVLVFAMWILVAAFPSQDRSPAPPLPSPPRQLPWAAPMAELQERLAGEWRKKDRKGSSSVMPAGMMAELQRMERAGRALMEAGPAETGWAVQDLAEACRAVGEELGPFRRQVREVFHRIVQGRAEVVEFLEHGGATAGDLSSASSSSTAY